MPESNTPPLAAAPKPKRPRLDWATLQARTFGEDVWRCPCGGRRRVLAVVSIPAAATKDLVERGFKASDAIRKMAGEVGGKPEMAQAGGTDASGVERAFEKLFEVVQGD